MSFADVDLSSDSIGRGPPHNPGAGGWPTIRYFNQETGIEGASYEKKTTMSICDELGPKEEYLMEYILQVADISTISTALCATDGTGCDERSLVFLNEMKLKQAGDWKAELDRLKALEEKPMKADLKDWVKSRRKIVAALISEQEESKLEL